MLATFDVPEGNVSRVRRGRSNTPMQALMSATSTAARVMKIDGAGSLQTGKWADLVVLNANPLMDIKNTRQIDSVYIGGRKVNMAAVTGTN